VLHPSNADDDPILPLLRRLLMIFQKVWAMNFLISGHARIQAVDISGCAA
jgi:hypothetical protein